MSINDESIALSDYGTFTRITIMMKNNWVQRGDRNFLWLPQEYRNTYSAFHSNILGIGLNSGQVSFIQLD
jgi:hypothetical protein